MKQVNRWILLCVSVFLGWLGVVKSIQQPYMACKTLHKIFIDRQLDIICNSNAIVYINQVTLNDLGSDSDITADNNSECQKTSASACFRSIPSEIPWNYTFFRKISEICNGNHNCTLEYNELNFYATKFRALNICSNYERLYKTRIGCFYECFPSEGKVFVGKSITETRERSLYLTSIKTGRCLIRGSIESARILEQVNMTFTVSDRKSSLCAGGYKCIIQLQRRSVKEFLLEIQTTNTLRGKLWIEFKGTSLQLGCGNNIQFPSAVREVQDPEQNGASTLLTIIIGLVAGLLLLIALILVVLKRKHEAKNRTINATTTLERDEDCTYYNNEVDKPRNDANDAQGTSYSFDDSLYNTIDTDGNYSQINIKKYILKSGGRNGEHNVKNGADDTEKSRDESRDTNNVTPRSSNTTEIKPNTIIGEVTGDVYFAVCKTDDLESMRISGPKGLM